MRAPYLRSQKGDTLVEVTIALAIFSLIMVSAFVTADRSYNLGQTARERSMLTSVAQEQAEALKSFRDSHTWAEFTCGSSGCSPRLHGPACGNFGPGALNTSYCGIRVGTDHPTGSGCDGDPANQCFHMELRRVSDHGQIVEEWVPIIDANLGLIGSGYTYFNIGTPAPVAILGNTGGPLNAQGNNYFFEFYEGYGNAAIGNGGAIGSLVHGQFWLRLADLDGFHS